MDINNGLLSLYRDHVETVLLPFWKGALDRQNGGIYSCYNNTGDELVSTDKYTWSQGRFLWLWSKLAGMISENKLAGEKAVYLEQLSKTARFLEENVFLENGNCAFLLTEKGEKKESIPGEGFDTSLYADCFVALGLGKFAALSGDRERFERSLKLYDRLQERIEKGNIRTDPYPVPPGYRAHSIPMIMLNIAQELADAARRLNHPKEELLYEQSVAYMKDIMDHFYREKDHRVVEMLPVNPPLEEDTLLSRHVNPGHTIESMWFVIHTARKTGYPAYVDKAIKAVDKAINLGWDPVFGGLLRFVDREGEGDRPRGMVQATSYEQLILDSWDMKLWWPHSEALYSTLLAYALSGDQKMWRHYKKIENYVFDTFPNPDKKIGEWIQIRDRRGAPIDKIAALPVKDPFHILRNMLLIIDLLEDKSGNN